MSHVGYDVEKYGTLNHAPIMHGEAEHPRFNEYLRYRSAMTAQLVDCQPFKSWLREQEDFEAGRVTFFQAGEKCDPEQYIAGKWYIGHTPPRSRKWASFGPYNTEAEARAAAVSAGLRGKVLP